MKRLGLLTLAVGVLAAALGSVQGQEKNPVVVVSTSLGVIKIELFQDKAPITVKNFLRYADEKFYDGTVFHRVIPKFMIQGGGFVPGLKQKETHDPIRNEAGNGISNKRGTIAMARTRDPNSATAQFFINLTDNGRVLDRQRKGRKGEQRYVEITLGECRNGLRRSWKADRVNRVALASVLHHLRLRHEQRR